MLTDAQTDAYRRTYAAAIAAVHRWPGMAATEAMLESAWLTSELARDDNNLFGMKAHAHPLYETVSLPTREFLDGRWVATTAEWVKYPDVESCFRDRMATLIRLQHAYPHYAAALAATNPRDYVTEVSLSWSTDPKRAAKVLWLYQAYSSLLGS